MAKVILTDNYDRETVSDKLIKDNLTQEEAETLATEMNAGVWEDGPDYYKAVEDSYELWDASKLY